MDLPSTPPVTPAAPPPPIVMGQKPFSALPRHRSFKWVFILIGAIVLVTAGVLFLPRFIKFPKKSSPLTITYWGLWEPNSIMKPLIDEYESAHPGVKVEYVFQSPREYRERLQNALSSGKGPDIFRIHNSWIPMFKADLSPVPADVFSASDFESSFYPTTKSDLRQAGNYVSIPLEIDGLALYTNDDLFSQAGKSVPLNWAEFRQTAIDLCVGDTEDGKCRSGEKILIAGAGMGSADNVDHWQDIISLLMLQNNVNLNSPSGLAAQDVLSYYVGFTGSLHVWDSTLPNSTLAFASGKLAMYLAPSWRVFDIQSLNPDLKFTVHPLPQPPIDVSRGEHPVTWASYWTESVNKKSPHVQAAWDFLKFLSSSESMQKLYKLAADSGRAFGEPYSRKVLGDSLQDAPYVGPYISQAQYARSWYMASSTYDGPTGINTQLSKYFADAINSGGGADSLQTLSAGINQVLSRYGIVSPTTPTSR